MTEYLLNPFVIRVWSFDNEQFTYCLILRLIKGFNATWALSFYSDFSGNSGVSNNFATGSKTRFEFIAEFGSQSSTDKKVLTWNILSLLRFHPDCQIRIKTGMFSICCNFFYLFCNNLQNWVDTQDTKSPSSPSKILHQ